MGIVGRIASMTGWIASVGCIALCGLLLFRNPYTGSTAGADTIGIVTATMMLPACLGGIATYFRIRWLMFVVFLWSLPIGLYMAVASTPSVWNGFGAVLVLYLASALTMGRTEARG